MKQKTLRTKKKGKNLWYFLSISETQKRVSKHCWSRMLLKYLLSINETQKRVNKLLGEKAFVLFEKQKLATERG